MFEGLVIDGPYKGKSILHLSNRITLPEIRNAEAVALVVTEYSDSMESMPIFNYFFRPIFMDESRNRELFIWSMYNRNETSFEDVENLIDLASGGLYPAFVVTVTTNESDEVVCVSRQNKEGTVAEIIWEKK